MNQERDVLAGLRSADDEIRARAWGYLAGMNTADVLRLIDEISDRRRTPNWVMADLALIGFCELLHGREERDRDQASDGGNNSGRAAYPKGDMPCGKLRSTGTAAG